MKRIVFASGVGLILFIVITGCQQQQTAEPISLTIYSPLDSSAFYKRYAYHFEAAFPGMILHSTQKKPTLESVELPDLIFLSDPEAYRQWVRAGKLKKLDTYIYASAYDYTQLSPVVQSLLLRDTDGLYGMAPTYQSSALYYNKLLFEEHGIPLPQNDMSWEEVLGLAQRFPNEGLDGESLYGFVTSYYREILFSLMLEVGQSRKLTAIDDQGEVRLHDAAWREIAEMVLTAYRSGAIATELPMHEPIFTGHAAMQVLSDSAPASFENYPQIYDAPAVDWGVVTIPSSPEYPYESNAYRIGGIFAISAQSEQPEEAWKFIDYITTDASYLQASLGYWMNDGLPARVDLNSLIGIEADDPLLLLEPSEDHYNPYDWLAAEAVNAFKAVGQLYMEQVLAGEMTLEEALRAIEEHGTFAAKEALRVEE